MVLVRPSTKYQKSYLEAVAEGGDEAGPTVISKPAQNQLFSEFVKNKTEESMGLHLPEGYVPATELWLVDGDEFIGTVNIRHTLTKHLLKVGGHIGYWIRPSRRNMGYGKHILRLSLTKAKNLGINKILVTCDETNIGSRKIIEANGGILENIVENDHNNRKKMRYWITFDHH